MNKASPETGSSRSGQPGLSPKFGFWLRCVLLVTLLGSVTRLGLAAWLALTTKANWEELTLAVLTAVPLDLAMTIVVAFVFLPAFVLPKNFWRNTFAKLFAHLFLLATAFVALFTTVATYFFWHEFDSLFNGIAVSYLVFPREVIGNLHESFNLSFYLPLIGIAAVCIYLPLRRPLSHALASPEAKGQRRRALAFAGMVSALSAGMVWNGPLANFENRQVDEIASNPVWSLFYAFLTNDEDYDGRYPGIAERDAIPIMRTAVRQDNTSDMAPPEKRSLLRQVDNGRPADFKPLNIVIVIEESFGATFVDSLDNDRGVSISPNLDRLAKDGLFFDNIYATGDRTVRGLEAILTSFTPIPGISTARRAGSEGMNSLPFLLNDLGYESAFLYAGLNLFDNMGKFWEGIGFDHQWDQRDIADPDAFKTIWGVADEFLFSEALKRLDEHAHSLEQIGRAEGKPFLLSLLTVSNHRPYKFPHDNVPWREDRGRIENTATYADWAFGDFIERARGRPWFDDTLFVFVADHEPKINGSAHVPVEWFHIPLLIYAPKHVKPQRSAVLGSSLDVAPTLLGLLSLSYDNPFFGVDLLRVPAGGGRIAMAHNYSVAYGRKDQLVVLEPTGEIKGYRMPPTGGTTTPLPAPATELADEAVAITQTAHRMFYQREYHWRSKALAK